MSSMDFNKSMLPHNRKELFFDIIKNHYRDLMVIGLILLAFSIPLLVVSFFSDYQIFILGTKDLEEATYNQYVISYSFYMNLFKALALSILGVGVGAVIKVIKNLCYLEPVFLGYDLKSGLKNNWLSMSVLFFIIGIFNAATMLLIQNLLLIEALWASAVIGVTLTVVFMILYPPLMLMIPHISIYTNKFHKRLFSSFFMYVRYFLPTLGIFILVGLPFLLFLIPEPYFIFKYMAFAILCIFLIPICYVIVFLYSSHVFDKCINQYHFPELVDKGINRIK